MKALNEERREEFIELTKKLHSLCVDFCLRAAEIFEVGHGSALNVIQTQQIVIFELEAIKKQISDLHFVELVSRKVEVDLAKSEKRESSN